MSKEILNHTTIGEVEWAPNDYIEDYFCEREFEFLGSLRKFEVDFVSCGIKIITTQQVNDYLYFMENSEKILKNVSQALLKYYLECYEKMALNERGFERISSESELLPLLSATNDDTKTDTIYIKNKGNYIGMEFHCEWDYDNGIGIKIVDGEVDEIGGMDILLQKEKEILNHEIIGEVEWAPNDYIEDYFCEREFEFLGSLRKFEVDFVSYGEKIITEQQVNDYLYFMKNSEKILKNVSQALLEYYLECYEEMALDERDFEEISSESELIPLLGKENDDGKFEIIPTIYFEDDMDYIGMGFNCKWDDDNGIGIQIVDGEVDEIGGLDIVL